MGKVLIDKSAKCDSSFNSLFLKVAYVPRGKNKTISEDQRDQGKEEIDELTKKYVKQIDEILKAKTEEIMEI